MVNKELGRCGLNYRGVADAHFGNDHFTVSSTRGGNHGGVSRALSYFDFGSSRSNDATLGPEKHITKLSTLYFSINVAAAGPQQRHFTLQNNNKNEQDWMFLSGSSFRTDPTTIYYIYFMTTAS